MKNSNSAAFIVLLALAGAFLLLGKHFMTQGAGPTPVDPEDLHIVDPVFTNPATVRLSANKLEETEGDMSGMQCYSCHQEDETVELPYGPDDEIMLPKDHLDLIYARMNCPACHLEEEEVDLEWDDDDNLIIPEAHRYLTPMHGRHGRNNYCFNCHMPDRLDKVKNRRNQVLSLTESTQLCGSCHGPSLREWEAGMHGRVSGYWDLEMGESKREDCTSCHDPHAPAFPSLKPAPGPGPTAAGAVEPSPESESDSQSQSETH